MNGEALTKGKEGETEKEIENKKVSVNHKEQTTYLLCLLLQIIECYVKAVPSLVSQAGFELTRLIDEAVPWRVKDSPLSAMTAVTASINTISTILGPIIRALRQATNARQCKWFGSSEDCVKLISQLLVMPDWDVTMKRSPLAKLLLLSKCSKLHEVDRELSLSVRQLVRTLLKQSGMFQGHGLVDLELKTEQAAWLDALSVCDNSILIFDSILRIAHHWNNELCIEASDRIDMLTSGIGYIADQSSTKNYEDKRIVVPFSPVMSCSINLTSNNFDILASHLPKHIRIHVDPTQSDKPHDSITSTEIKDGVSSTAAFLSKYSNGFRAELHELLMDVAMTSAIKARSAGSYGQCLLAVVDRRHASNKSESLLLNEIINMSVMLSIQSTYSHPSTSHNALADAATPIKGKVSRKSIVVKNSTTGPGSKEFFEGIMKNCDINSSIDLLMGVLMRTVEGADATVNATIKRPRNTPATSKVLSTLSLKDDLMQNRIRLQCSVIGFFVQNIEKIISSSFILISNPTQEDDPETGLFLDLLDTVGLYTASLCYNLSIVPLGTSFYNWVAGLALRLMSKSTEIGDNLQLENKATIIIESMRLLIPFARTYTAVSIEIESESKTSLDSACTSASTSGLKRKTRSPVVIESKTEVIVAIYEAVSNLTSLIVELVRQTSCAPLIADALSNSELLDGITNRDLVGKKSRQILCAAASAYFRRSNARSKKGMETQGHNNPEHVTLALWKSISDRLLTISIATTSMSIGPDDSRHTSLQEFESDKFSLGWMIQHFVDNPLLRSQFINLALKDGQGHSLLDLSTKQNVATASTPFALIPLDDVSLTVLQSASVETLASALESFADMDMQKVSNTVLGAPDDSIISNALCCATFKLGSTNDTRLPFVSSFISPLSLMELNLSKQTEDLRTNNRIYQICPLCPSMIRYAESPEFVSVVLPVCIGRGELPLIEVVKIFMEYEHIEKGRVRHNGDIGRLSLLLSIEETAASSSGSQTITSICRLLSHPAIVGSSYTLCLLASYLQSQLTLEAKMTYLKGSFAAIAICSSLSDVLRSVDADNDDNDVLLLWCGAYLKFLSNLLDDFILYLTTLETLVPANSELSSHVSAFFALLQPLLMISVYTAKTEQFKLDKIIDTLQSTASEVRKKMNKWIKSCLKFGLHSSSLLNGLSNFFCTCRESFLTKVTTTRKESKVGEHSFWASIFLPKVTDFYHPSLVLQMVVSHSKFSTVLKGIKQSLPNTSLLNFLLVLFSISLPLSQNGDKNFHLDDSKNSKGSVADQFLVSALLSIYSGTMSMADRLVLRILHVLNNADKCPALYTLMPITMNSKKAVSSSKGSSVSIFGTILQQLVYPTLSQYPAWRSAIPQPSLSEGLEAEKSYRHQFSLIVRNAAKDWSSDEIDEGGDVEPHNSLMDDDEQNITGYNLPTKKSKVSNDDSDEEGDSGSESESMSENRSEGQHSDMESILSVVSNGEVSSEWNCDDTDAYVPSVDTLSSCSDKVYDPCFWLPALHYSLIQESYSVRQLANTGALSLIIAGISSRCPILRSIALSSLQRVLELVRQQTPDKDAGFRERPQLLLLLNFIRNALDSFAPSSSGATQFPSVISLFLSRAALHLLQPTHELYSKINKYLLSRPFCDFKDVPLYDLLLVDGDAQTEQASRLTTFRMVRDGLCTRWDHLNMCRKNAYNRLMLLFPVLSKDSRAGHAIFDLLDKALGMQVSARYLLERCSIVSWLQQMASPSNSLDIDTSAAAANDSVDTHDIPNEVTADDIEDENEILKGKSGRSIVVRSQSQPSVLLAASPRLLARVLCLMRRALGASYLLSAGSNSSNSGHLDQIVLAISTIIDVRLCSMQLVLHHLCT